MAGQVVQMDYAVIGDVSKGFATAKDVLGTVRKVLTALIGALVAASFFSFGTNAAMIRYLKNIVDKLKKLEKVCGEFSGDLARAIDDHKRGDVKGKRYFGEGVRA